MARKTSSNGKKPLIGFVGQGYVGKTYSDDFERRGFVVVRYSLEKKYLKNKEAIANCDVVFIAVPTPTTPNGFDYSIVREALKLVGVGRIAVIKSTVIPGTTKELQTTFSDRVVFFSPEFLSEKTASYDVSHPFSSIIGMPKKDIAHTRAVPLIQRVLPKAPHTIVCDSTEAEIIKYAHNCHGYVQVVLWNLFYDLSEKIGSDWYRIEKALSADPFISSRYLSPVSKKGRGAGGHCFIKDFSAFKALYGSTTNDASGLSVLQSIENKNIELLRMTKKDPEIVKGVYGKN